jgi:diacylglycerol kinase
MNSFHYAFSGWWYVLRTQPNAWIHAAVTMVVVLLGLWLRLPRQDWAILILTFMVVWMAEFSNTALEAVVDMASPAYHPLAKTAKDVAAAAVLVGACGSVLIGLLILGPPLWARLVAVVNP